METTFLLFGSTDFWTSKLQTILGNKDSPWSFTGLLVIRQYVNRAYERFLLHFDFFFVFSPRKSTLKRWFLPLSVSKQLSSAPKKIVSETLGYSKKCDLGIFLVWKESVTTFIQTFLSFNLKKNSSCDSYY